MTIEERKLVFAKALVHTANDALDQAIRVLVDDTTHQIPYEELRLCFMRMEEPREMLWAGLEKLVAERMLDEDGQKEND